MNAILSKEYRSYVFYDKALAVGIQGIIESIKINNSDDKVILGLKYDENNKADKTVFQMIKIINATSHNPVELYLQTSRKTFNQLKKEKLSINLKRVNLFTKLKGVYIMKSDYVLYYIKAKYYDKEELYSNQILEQIWDAYYEPHGGNEDEI